MRTLQFSLLGLLGVVSFVAVGCAALANPNEWWTALVTNSMLVALAAAALAAFWGHSAGRAFWGGFALVACGYLLMGGEFFAFPLATPNGPGYYPTTDASPLVTTRLLELLAENVLPEAVAARRNPYAVYGGYGANPAGYVAPAAAAVPVEMPADEPPLPDGDQPQMPDEGDLASAYMPGSTGAAPVGAFAAYPTAQPATDWNQLSRFMSIGHTLWAVVFGLAGGLLARTFYVRRERLAGRAAPTSG